MTAITPAPRPSHGPVRQDLDALLLVDGEPTLPVQARLTFVAHDPLAVTMTFRTDARGVDWTFARSLLADGIRRPVGDGDVHVRPDAESVILRLSSPGGRAEFLLDPFDLAVFLDATYDQVPEGDESFDAGIDELLTDLLGAA